MIMHVSLELMKKLKKIIESENGWALNSSILMKVKLISYLSFKLWQ